MYQCFARNQYGTAVTAKSALKKAGKDCYSVSMSVSVVDSLASTPPGMPGTHPPNISVGGTSTGISPIIITYFRIYQTSIGCPPFAQPQADFVRL